MTSRDVPTLILRFRDLVTRVGETIEHHQAIAERRGRVWWGWWHKGGEKAPTNIFKRLKEGWGERRRRFHVEKEFKMLG